MNYPLTPTSAIIDDYHGTSVPDPYRWLEDTDAPETRTWIEAQNTLTFSFLGKLLSRPLLRQRLEQVWNYAKAWAPMKRGGRYFQLRNSGLQNQDVLYVLDDLQAEPRLLLDPNTLSPDGTVSLSNWSISPDGATLAYATSRSGSDWLEWRVRDTITAQDLPDNILWSKFSGAAWLKDGSGFFYARYDTPAEGQDFLQANYYHKLTSTGWARPRNRMCWSAASIIGAGFDGNVTHDRRYLVISVWVSTDQRNCSFTWI
jgi:prolyl oligopeptidase